MAAPTRSRKIPTSDLSNPLKWRRCGSECGLPDGKETVDHTTDRRTDSATFLTALRQPHRPPFKRKEGFKSRWSFHRPPRNARLETLRFRSAAVSHPAGPADKSAEVWAKLSFCGPHSKGVRPTRSTPAPEWRAGVLRDIRQDDLLRRALHLVSGVLHRVAGGLGGVPRLVA